MSEKPISITVNNAPIIWSDGNRSISFFGTDSILFWVKPSLFSILQPLQEELGEELYSHLLAFESSKGTYEDYYFMINNQGKNFVDGFHGWGHAVSAAGWGHFQIEKIDWKEKTATVSIENPWELKLFQTKKIQNNIPFLAGKISGIFSHAFSTNCIAKVIEIAETNNNLPKVTLELSPSNITLEQALMKIHEEEKSSENERMRALNNALRRNEKRFLDVLDTVGDCIWEADRHLHLTFFTRKARDVFRMTNTELMKRSWKDILGGEFTVFQKLLNNLSSDTPFVEGEFHFYSKEKHKIWVLVRVKLLLDINRNHLGYVGSCRDITKEKEMQENLLQQQKNTQFASKMATLGEMAGGIAHEINTPLATISILSEQIQDILQEPKEQIDIPQCLNAAKKIFKTTERIAKIVQGLRTFARDATQDPMTEALFYSIVEDTLSLCKSRFTSHGVEIKMEGIPKDLVIRCRPIQIEQVLLNLLNNAFDAVSESKEKWVSISLESTEHSYKIRLQDSGPPISTQVREKIMNPFFTTKPVGKGTGLGLSISRGIIESHGGTLYLEENMPHTSFVIELPLG